MQSECRKKRIQLVTARAQLQLLLNENDASAEHATKINDAQKKLRSLENTLKRGQLPPDFSQRLEKFVQGYVSGDKGNITIEVAPTQADPCIAKMAVQGDVDLSYAATRTSQFMLGPMDSLVWQMYC